MKAIVINAKERTVTMEEVGSDTLNFVQQTVEGYIELGWRGKKDDCLYVNEEGLLLKHITYGFQFRNYKFVGNGIIMGVNEDGATVDTTMTVDEVKALVRFL